MGVGDDGTIGMLGSSGGKEVKVGEFGILEKFA